MVKKITVKGAVQGVGYRPFIAEMGTKYGLLGCVKNIGAAVEIKVAGEDDNVQDFIDHLYSDMPQGAFILSVSVCDIQDEITELLKFNGVEIVESNSMDFTGDIPVFLPDIGICDDCMKELLDKDNRRYHYPLISCAVCGPRISILNRLPYDRANTTMDEFDLCYQCKREYLEGRRWYAQTISCNSCGPHWGFSQKIDPKFFNAFMYESGMKQAINALNKGLIIAFKGVSGYQLMCKPISDAATELRQIKGRESKPFAIMYPTIDDIKKDADVSPLEEKLLTSSARPIVLLRKKRNFPEAVDMNSAYIGAFLPASGAHRMILDETGPLIVTSCNKSDSPIIINNSEFKESFEMLVEGVYFYDRNINIPQDDSVMFVISAGGIEEAQFIRRSRGFFPLPVTINTDKLHLGYEKVPETILALGGDLKAAPAIACGDKIMPSQYIGDLENEKTLQLYKQTIDNFENLFMQKPTVIVGDLHPRYHSTAYGRSKSKNEGIPFVQLQHHFAHIYSVMAENSMTEAIGVALDGTGYGEDGKIWGGEFVYCCGTKHERMGNLCSVKLVGADSAAKNAKTVARCYIHECVKMGLLSEDKGQILLKDETPLERQLINSALDNDINTFESSSMGRFFDAVCALLGIANYNDYEGKCAVMLEQEAAKYKTEHQPDSNSRIGVGTQLFFNDDSFEPDPFTAFADLFILKNSCHYPVSKLAYYFHQTVVKMIVMGCMRMREKTGVSNVCLSGGCFNNRIILEGSVEALINEGFSVVWNQKVPLGDGGISLGQAYYGLLLARDGSLKRLEN